MAQVQAVAHSTRGESLADVLERVLNTGVVIAGDIRIKLCDVELLSIQLRLLICSVEKAKELGIDWWSRPTVQPDQAVPETPPRPQKRPPEPEPATTTPWEQYERFREFQQFQKAMGAFEEQPGQV